jgi:hypothetical protein
MARGVHSVTEGGVMWQDTAWSWVFIIIVVVFGLAFGG